ncbi:13801_t:CDS:2 [Entrophospora sp. SA101]|nr:13801_t:CDS:2 [Entrophospora sp. SA101]CAJ0900358.1 17408_t:CDS:2 [Entrophospora sp. SA101]
MCQQEYELMTLDLRVYGLTAFKAEVSLTMMDFHGHPFYIHPEYLSRSLKPSPAFLGFVSASAGLTIELLFKN